MSTSRSTISALHPPVRDWLADHPDFAIVDAIPVTELTVVTVANTTRRVHLISTESTLTAFVASPQRTLSLALAQYGERQ